MSNKKIIFYYQTFKSLKPILIKNTVVTHIHLSSIHFGLDEKNNKYIHLNDNSPYWIGFEKMWDELKQAKALGIKIILMVGGAGGAFNSLFTDYDTYYGLLKELLISKKDIISGIDLDVEENTSISNIKKIIRQINTDFRNDFIISMAPVAYSIESDTPGMGGFKYKELYNSEEGKYINYFNGQFYYDLCEKSYENVINNGYPPEKIIFGVESGQNINDIKEIVCKLSKKYPDFGGIFNWEYGNMETVNPYDWCLIMKNAMDKKEDSYYEKIVNFINYYIY